MSSYRPAPTLYGFEDYKCFVLNSQLLYANYISKYYLYNWNAYNGHILYPVKGDSIPTSDIEEHKDLLAAAKTIYIHPACNVSKTLVSQKYKKVLNPWLADIVMIPNITKYTYVYYDYCHVFINAESKNVFLFLDSTKDNAETISHFPQGTKLIDVMKSPGSLYGQTSDSFSVASLISSELDYTGRLIDLRGKEREVIDILEGTLPKSKFVFEDTVMHSLSNEDNKPTFENLLSILEMLNSTDDDTNASAIRALAAMDFINYPNSVATILVHSNKNQWKYNKATNSTAAKYMFHVLFNNTARGYFTYTNKFISQEDYELTHKLLRHFYNNEDTVLDFLRTVPFTYEDETFDVHPRLRP